MPARTEHLPKYRRVLAEWLAGTIPAPRPGRPATAAEAHAPTVNDVLLAY